MGGLPQAQAIAAHPFTSSAHCGCCPGSGPGVAQH